MGQKKILSEIILFVTSCPGHIFTSQVFFNVYLIGEGMALEKEENA